MSRYVATANCLLTAIATFGDNELLDSYSARCWQWLNVTAMSQNVC